MQFLSFDLNFFLSQNDKLAKTTKCTFLEEHELFGLLKNNTKFITV